MLTVKGVRAFLLEWSARPDGFLQVAVARTHMLSLSLALTLAGDALGAFGGLLVFIEFFQIPSYLEYEPEFDSYNFDISPLEVTEHTWIGRIGGLLIGLAFALQFTAALV